MAKSLSLDLWLSDKAEANPLPRLLAVFSDEPLFCTQIGDTYRRRARLQFQSQRQVIELDRGFDESQFLSLFSELSLFGEASLIDLRIPQLKFTKETTQALAQVSQWIAQGQTDNLLLVTGPLLNKTQRASAGLSSLLELGTEVICPAITSGNMSSWIASTAKRLGLQLSVEASQWLAERTEGNLLAGWQTLEKLSLQASGIQNLEQVQQAATHAARYNVFELSQAVLAADRPRIKRMLAGLQAEGEAPTLVLWALQEDVRALRGIKQALRKGVSLAEACKQHRIWGPRQSLIGPCERKHSLESLAQLTACCYRAEKTIKGLRAGNPWILLEMIALGIGGLTPLTHLDYANEH